MKKITGIKAICFDADGTLFDFEKVMRNSLGLTLSELRVSDSIAADGLNIEKLIEIRNRVTDELKGKISNFEEIRLAGFKRALEEVGRPDDALASHITQFYLSHRYDDIELFDDVVPTLKALSLRYNIGVVSNGNSYPERCGLPDTFNYTVFSQDCGIEKPDPRIFQVALEKVGCAANEMLSVGDSLSNDIVCAARAGLKTIWLNRQNMKADSEIHPDHEIHSLIELLDIL